jgi:hypothetical protein
MRTMLVHPLSVMPEVGGHQVFAADGQPDGVTGGCGTRSTGWPGCGKQRGNRASADDDLSALLRVRVTRVALNLLPEMRSETLTGGARTDLAPHRSALTIGKGEGRPQRSLLVSRGVRERDEAARWRRA